MGTGIDQSNEQGMQNMGLPAGFFLAQFKEQNRHHTSFCAFAL